LHLRIVSRENPEMLAREAKIELLKRVPLFEECSRRELREIAAVADEIVVPAGTALASEGQSGRELVIIVEGSADVTKRGRKINEVGGGDFVGEIAVVTDRPRTASVKTTRPTHALVLTRRDFRTLMKRVPTIQIKVLETLARRLLDTE
jgi:CRP/FNR family transcriptional regulator, cyclic AMP receptor protein